MIALNISPNPANNNLTVTLENQDNSADQKVSVKEIQIIDKMGQIRERKQYQSNLIKVNINISKLKPDVYTIKVFNGFIWENAQFIKK